MAQLDTSAAQATLSSVIKKLQETNLFSDENASAILSPAADELLSSAKSAFMESGHNNTKPRRTGKTFKAFTRSKKLFRDKSDVPYMFVTLTGKDHRGQRYGEKAFVLNYGRRKGGKIPADYYLTNAAKATRPRINQLMIQKAEEIFSK